MASKPKKSESSQLSRYRSDPAHSLAHTASTTRQTSSSTQSQLRPSTPGINEGDRSTPLSRLFRRNRTNTSLNTAHQLALEAPSSQMESSPPAPTPAPAPPPPLPTPLLAGCPGREITGAKTNGREWACDLDEPPVLGYSEELSKTDFEEHPLGRFIKLEKGWEKHQLAMYGLILPAKVENGTPIYTWESDSEDEEDMDKALVLSKEKRLPAKPPTQVERPRTPSNILHKVKSFANFIATSDAEKDVPELPTLKELLDQFGLPPGTPSDTAPRSFLRTTRSSSSLRPKTPTRPVPSATKLRSKRSAGIERSQISNPIAPEEMRRVGSDFSQAVARRGRNVPGGERDSLYASSLRSPSNLISPSLSTSVPLYLLQPQHPTVYFGQNEPPPEFRHAPPRLAPMEYIRQYYIAKAKAKREGVDCTIRKPAVIWAWTEDFKEFLLLPQLPAGLQRNFLPDDGKDCKFSKMGRSSKNKDVGKRRSFVPLPLDLGPSTPLMPAHFRSNSYSFIGSDHKYRSSSDGFLLDRPTAARYESLVQSTRLLLDDPSTPLLPAESHRRVSNITQATSNEVAPPDASFQRITAPISLSTTSVEGSLPARRAQSGMTEASSPCYGSATSYERYHQQFTLTATGYRDENNVSPLSFEHLNEMPFTGNVSPLSNSPASAQTEVFAPMVTRRQETQQTLDDALTPVVEDETFHQSISDDAADIADTSSVYSQNSAVTAVHHPLTGCRPSSTDLMLLAPTTSELENGEGLTPRQPENLPSHVAHFQERASRRSPVLEATSCVPSPETAQSYIGYEETDDTADHRYSEAPSSSISNFSSQATGSAVDRHDRYSTASRVSTATSVSTAASLRLPIQGTPASLESDYAKVSSKYARHVATEMSAPEASSRISSMRAQDPLPPSQSSVTRNLSSSPHIPSSVTSADTAAYYRQKRLPKRPEPAHKDPVTEAIESSRNSELPSLHVRRRRAVPSLPQISASQAYPKPLRLSTMKSPSPAPTASSADRAASAASTGTVARSTSRLITDIGNELNREMEEVLSPRSAAMAHHPLTPKKEVDVDTPTRRPRQVQSMKAIPFNAPPLPAPNKPLPSIPQPKTPKPKPKSEAPDSAFIDVDFGPGPAKSYVPARPPPPIPVLKPIDTTSPSAFDTTFDPYVTRADFSIKRDRTVRPAASMAAMSPRPTPLVDQRQQRINQPTTSAYVQRPANAPSRFLGKMASMAELKNGRRDTISSRSTDSDDAVGMRTFLSEDSAASSASSSTRDKATSGSKRKFLSNLFKRNRKDGEN
ncbi:hypothetical protein JMJ77_0014650 [Colletotrichum scovillei]|uniref:Uncharacterized protein n=1 Tax=Colletotrichum scovillei TaxID=1209932 RepID=A0A9P7U8A0_9PEZI|nr:hypothetical protein JMJ77_0014650 [Colletotrichum scovillei]KAG7056259.1 hypothetical protein JMJ78_0000063 [Colletotrichum scovillei]KAG7066190.1 hypothetical protein JMJ76_0000057 [Colletotrichum scovillei]